MKDKTLGHNYNYYVGSKELVRGGNITLLTSSDLYSRQQAMICRHQLPLSCHLDPFEDMMLITSNCPLHVDILPIHHVDSRLLHQRPRLGSIRH